MTLAESLYQAWASKTGNPACPFQDLQNSHLEAWEAVAELATTVVMQANTLYKIVDPMNRDYDLLIGPAGQDLDALDKEYKENNSKLRKTCDRFVDWLEDEKGFKRAEPETHAFEE